MAPHAHVLHRMPGRVRLRIPSRRRDAAFFEHLKSMLEAHEAVDAVTVNPLTGSVLIQGRHGAAPEVAAYAAEHGLFQVALPQQEQDAAQIALQMASRVDQRILAATHGKVSGEMLAVMAFATTGIYQLLKREVLPPAATLLWYAWEVGRAATQRRR